MLEEETFDEETQRLLRCDPPQPDHASAKAAKEAAARPRQVNDLTMVLRVLVVESAHLRAINVVGGGGSGNLLASWHLVPL